MLSVTESSWAWLSAHDTLTTITSKFLLFLVYMLQNSLEKTREQKTHKEQKNRTPPPQKKAPTKRKAEKDRSETALNTQRTSENDEALTERVTGTCCKNIKQKRIKALVLSDEDVSVVHIRQIIKQSI